MRNGACVPPLLLASCPVEIAQQDAAAQLAAR